jgi:hypothetical protein
MMKQSSAISRRDFLHVIGKTAVLSAGMFASGCAQSTMTPLYFPGFRLSRAAARSAGTTSQFR